MKFAITAFAVAVCASPLAAHAQTFISGSELVKACAVGSREPQSCNAFIAGALDEVTTVQELKGKVCLPSGTKLRTLREDVVSFAAERPETTRGSGVAMLNAMVSSRFPCRA